MARHGKRCCSQCALSGGMPLVRANPGSRQCGPHLRNMFGLVRGAGGRGLRSVRPTGGGMVAEWFRRERRPPVLPRVPKPNLWLWPGAELCALQGWDRAGDSSVEVRADGAFGQVVRESVA